MSGSAWPKAKREKFEAAFHIFLKSCYINSKNKGFIALGDHLYEGQKRFIDCVLDGLENDIHRFFVLKSRQLGLTTISRALSVFYIGIHRGLKGALVFDSSPNKENARRELETMIEDLPGKLKFPKVKAKNRDGLVLINSSEIQFKSAGVKKSKTSGTLGRSVGLSMAHLSELCSYNEDLEGLHSFERSLSDSNPDRLYIYESTARGHNHWEDMWLDAKDDPHCSTLFIGWWSHEGQSIPRDSADWARYGTKPPTDSELKKIEEVKEKYNFDVSMEQLAWYRRLMDPSQKKSEESKDFDPSNPIKLQEDPWTEEEAFQQTGAVFFSNEVLNDITTKHVDKRFTPYMFMTGQEFSMMQVFRASTGKSVDLKVWEEPDPDGEYVLGCDPAFGENENNDRSSIQVMRCFADGLDQVAEYASPMHTTQQLAWIIAALLGWYGGGANAHIRYALELNGPGGAVYTELKNLKYQIECGYQAQRYEEKGLKDIFRNVRTYLYNRVDAVGNATGWNTHIKTNVNLKVLFMERLRDYASNGQLIVRSSELVKEMATIAREGDSISAPANKRDDRVLSAAFAIHCWETGPRRNLVLNKRTREAETARKRVSILDQVNMFQQNQLGSFFETKRRARVADQRMAVRQTWRYR